MFQEILVAIDGSPTADRALQAATELATTVLKQGNAGEGIVEQVESGEHDLLVMGSRGRGRVATNLLGSVGAHVHYHSRVPMLVIHPED